MQQASLGIKENSSTIEQNLKISNHFVTVKSEIDSDTEEDRKAKVKIKLEVFEEDSKNEEYSQRNEYQEIKPIPPATIGITDYTKFSGFAQFNSAYRPVGANNFPTGFGFSQFYRPFVSDRSSGRTTGGPFGSGGRKDSYFDGRFDPDFQQGKVNSYTGFPYSYSPLASQRYLDQRNNTYSIRQGKFGSVSRSVQPPPQVSKQ